nr:replicase [Pelargonium zonate spot virus]
MAATSFNVRDLINSNGADAMGVRGLVDAHATKAAEEQFEYIKRSKKVWVRQILSASDGEKMQKRFGGTFDLQLSQEFIAPHSFAGAMRQCETLECLSSFPEDSLILDFGGSWLFHWQRQHNVHSCCPVLDARDMARHQERMISMQKCVAHRPGKFEAFESPDFCLLKAEDCEVRSPYAISIHGAYDMGFEGLCKAMHSHGTIMLRGTMMFDANMLVFDEGVMEDLNCRWTKEKGDPFGLRGAPCEDMVHFDFVDESTLSYSHSWKNIKSFLTEGGHQIGNVQYVLERCVISYGIMSFKIFAVSGKIPRTRLRHCVWFPKVRDYVNINVMNPSDPRIWSKVRVKLDTVREVEEICFRCFKESKSWEENLKLVGSCLSSKSSTIIVNGMTMMAGERLDVLDYHHVAFSLMLSARRKFDMFGKAMKSLEWKGWVSHFFKSLWPSGDLRDLFGRYFPSLIRYYDKIEFVEKLTQCEIFVNELGETDDEDQRDLVAEAANVFKNTLLKVAIKMSLDKTFKPTEGKGEEKTTVASSVAGDVIERPVDTVSGPTIQAPLVTQGNAVTPLSEPLDGRLAVRLEAMKEYKRYLLKLQRNTESNLAGLWSLCGGTSDSNNLISTEVLRIMRQSDSLVNLHKADGSWLFPNDFEYMVGYNSSGLGEKRSNEVFLVNKDCVLNNNVLLANGVPAQPPKGNINLMDGVAGCGKTTAIKRAFVFESDLIVTANKKSSEDIMKAMFNDTPDIGRNKVRTADSVLMHGVAHKVKRVLFDEVSLVHFGQLCAILTISGAEELIGFGDSEQISFVSRDRLFDMKYHKLSPDSSDQQIRTFRCPKDVVECVKIMARKVGARGSKYNNWFTTSAVRKSLGYHKVSSINELPLRPDVHYLTMTQADKASLLSKARETRFRPNVSTVDEVIKTTHESQGISVPKVILWRGKSTKCDLFTDKKWNYALVAVTRCTQSFDYYSVADVKGDFIAECIESTKRLVIS